MSPTPKLGGPGQSARGGPDLFLLVVKAAAMAFLLPVNSPSCYLGTDIGPHTASPGDPRGEEEMRLHQGVRGFHHIPQHIGLWARARASHARHLRQVPNKTVSMGLLLAQP